MDQFANLIAVACVIHFLWSYYRNCYRKGYSMDIWHSSLLFNLFVIHIMLPFSRSNLNVFALGPLLKKAQSHITEAYFVSAFGYIGILLGGNLWRINLGIGLREEFSRWVELPAKGSLLLLRSRRLLLIHGIVAIALLTGILFFYFRINGFGFNLRGLLLVMPMLRPVAQFAAFYSVLIASYCVVRFYLYREKELLPVIFFIATLLIFFGERANIIGIVSLLIVGIFVRLGRQLNLIWLGMGFAAALLVAFILNALRAPEFSLAAVIGGFAIDLFYGNSFSDTRDFALILSLWDRHYLWGKTYLAGLLAFVPRALSSFRDTWSYGVVTATIAGFQPTEHPGLRIGIFGEAYINFGLIGVAVLSLFIGAVLRLVDMRMKQSAAILPRSDIRLFSYYLITMWVLVAENSTSASTCYTIALIITVSWLMQRVGRFLQIPL